MRGYRTKVDRGPPDRHQPGPVPPHRDHAGLRGPLPARVGQPGAHAQLRGDRLRRRRRGHPPLPGRPARDAAGRRRPAPARRLARVRGLPAVRGVQLLLQQRAAAPRAVLDPRGPAARVPAVGRPVLISRPRRADDQPCRRPSSASAWFISTRWPRCGTARSRCTAPTSSAACRSCSASSARPSRRPAASRRRARHRRIPRSCRRCACSRPTSPATGR